jgi:hypothetical protein
LFECGVKTAFMLSSKEGTDAAGAAAGAGGDDGWHAASAASDRTMAAQVPMDVLMSPPASVPEMAPKDTPAVGMCGLPVS